MKILIHQNHIPYSYDLARALSPIASVSHCLWSNIYRPRPSGVSIVDTNESLGTDWDFLITDGVDPVFVSKTTARHRILILHCERMAPITKALSRFISNYDAVVTPSENKTGTWMDYPYKHRFVTIPLAVSPEDYPEIESYESASVGTAINAIQDRLGVAENWRALTDGFSPRVIIGGSNFEMLAPRDVTKTISNWNRYKEALRSLGVFVHVIEGNETGMAVREAMATGIPVVTGITPELYYFAYTGYDICMSRAACSKSIPELREWISRLQNDAGLRASIGKSGRRAIFRAYPMTSFVRQWQELVYSLAA